MCKTHHCKTKNISNKRVEKMLLKIGIKAVVKIL